MRLRLKYLWWAIMLVWGILAFFGVHLPGNSGAAMSLLASVDGWLFAHAVHPTLFALAVGLALGTVIIPEAWRLLKPHVFPVIPMHDWPIRDALRYVYIDSKWVSGRSIDHGNLLNATGLSFLDAARNGLVQVWGRPRHGLGQRKPIEAIAPTYWQQGRLNLVTCMLDSPALSCTMDQTYEELEVNRHQIYKKWPRASLVSRWRDRHKKARSGINTALQDRFADQTK